MKSESKIQSEILLEVNKRGHRLWRSNAGKVKTEHGQWIKLFPKGFPDTVGFRKDDGKFIAIEVKNEKGKLSKDQKHFLEKMRKNGAIAGVARSPEEAIDIVING